MVQSQYQDFVIRDWQAPGNGLLVISQIFKYSPPFKGEVKKRCS